MSDSPARAEAFSPIPREIEIFFGDILLFDVTKESNRPCGTINSRKGMVYLCYLFGGQNNNIVQLVALGNNCMVIGAHTIIDPLFPEPGLFDEKMAALEQAINQAESGELRPRMAL